MSTTRVIPPIHETKTRESAAKAPVRAAQPGRGHAKAASVDPRDRDRRKHMEAPPDRPTARESALPGRPGPSGCADPARRGLRAAGPAV